jgi:hypothetical protein
MSLLACVEVDIKADLSKKKDFNYVQRKTQKLLNFGTERAIWIFTDTCQIVIAEKKAALIIEDWDKEFQLLDVVLFNIGEYLKSEGIIVNGFQFRFYIPIALPAVQAPDHAA